MKILWKLLSLMLITQLILAQPSDQILEKSLLWKIEGKELKKPSFLFGTIHMIPAEDYFIPNGLLQSIDQVNTVFFEIDLNQINDISALMGIMDRVLMQNDTSLSDLLKPEEFSVIEKYFEEKGLPLTMFERMKPLFLSALVGVDGNPFALNEGSSKSYEIEIAELAKAKNLKIQGLESMDFQISIFDSIPYMVQAKMLMSSISSSDQNVGEMKKMIEHYKQQNLNALNQSITNEDQQFLPYMDMMLYNRNKNWIPIIIENIQKAPCLFAVGAGHLPGEQGIIQLLRKKGYKVKAVMEK